MCIKINFDAIEESIDTIETLVKMIKLKIST